MDGRFDWSVEAKSATEALADQKEYQSMVGSLMYAMLATRPDLAQTIQ